MRAGTLFDLQLGTWEDAEACLGRELAQVTGADEVAAGDIRRRLEVLAWDCALHYDEKVAHQHGYLTIVAPVTMLMSWSIPAYWKPGDPRPQMDDPALIPPLPVCQIPAPAEYLFATRSETEYFEPVYPGDRISATSILREITRKKLAVGDGAFLLIETTYAKQTGEVVGIESMTFFRYTTSDLPSPGSSV